MLESHVCIRVHMREIAYTYALGRRGYAHTCIEGWTYAHARTRYRERMCAYSMYTYPRAHAVCVPYIRISPLYTIPIYTYMCVYSSHAPLSTYIPLYVSTYTPLYAYPLYTLYIYALIHVYVYMLPIRIYYIRVPLYAYILYPLIHYTYMPLYAYVYTILPIYIYVPIPIYTYIRMLSLYTYTHIPFYTHIYAYMYIRPYTRISV